MSVKIGIGCWVLRMFAAMLAMFASVLVNCFVGVLVLSLGAVLINRPGLVLACDGPIDFPVKFLDAFLLHSS